MIRYMLAALTAAAAIWPVAACAHAKLLTTSPSSDARLDSAPQSSTLKFNEDVQLDVLKLAAAGKDIAVTFDDAHSAP